MPDPGDTSSSDAIAPARGIRSALTLAGLALLVGLGGWFMFGAMTATEPAAFVVAPAVLTPAVVAPAVLTPAVSAVVGEGEHVPGSSPIGVSAAVSVDNSSRVDPTWAATTAAATGIPVRAVRGYAGAELAMAVNAPGCGIRWSTLAALGSIESAHGTHAGSTIADDGVTRPGIFGIDLTGEASARITDSDGGRWDDTADIDRAVGPMQFIPETWETWGADGNGDGIRDPQQIDDAALAAAGYLCHSGDLRSPETWRTAIFAYNHLDSYVNAVAGAANAYASLAG